MSFEKKSVFLTILIPMGIGGTTSKNIIRKTCINFCVCKRKELNLECSRLIKRLIFVKNKFHAGHLSVTTEMKDLESALSALVLNKCRLRFDFRFGSLRENLSDLISLLYTYFTAGKKLRETGLEDEGISTWFFRRALDLAVKGAKQECFRLKCEYMCKVVV